MHVYASWILVIIDNRSVRSKASSSDASKHLVILLTLSSAPLYMYMYNVHVPIVYFAANQCFV